MKPLFDSFVWAYSGKMQVIITFGREGLKFCSGPDSWSVLDHLLPEAPLYFSELNGKSKNMQSALQNETVSICEVNRIG